MFPESRSSTQDYHLSLKFNIYKKVKVAIENSVTKYLQMCI